MAGEYGTNWLYLARGGADVCGLNGPTRWCEGSSLRGGSISKLKDTTARQRTYSILSVNIRMGGGGLFLLSGKRGIWSDDLAERPRDSECGRWRKCA